MNINSVATRTANEWEMRRTQIVRDELERLIEKARVHEMTEEERRQQAISFAYGNCAIENPDITRKMVEQAYDELRQAGRLHGPMVLVLGSRKESND